MTEAWSDPVTAVRGRGIRRVIRQLVAGRYPVALELLLQSVDKQLDVAAIGDPHLTGVKIPRRPELAEFRVTFGQKYQRQTHPSLPLADPDGWVTILAPDYATARRWLIERAGTEWCDLCEPDSLTQWDRWYPRGELDLFIVMPDRDQVVAGDGTVIRT